MTDSLKHPAIPATTQVFSPVTPHHEDHPSGPFVTLGRKDWAKLARNKQFVLSEETLDSLRGVQDPTNLDDVREVYLPLTNLLNLYREHTGRLFHDSNAFLHADVEQTPFVIGIAGSVAVGKSTVARLLRELIAQLPNRPKVALVPTDGFLYSTQELTRRGLLTRKGFPESYDCKALLQFVVDVKSGKPAKSPVYSHTDYDIVPDQFIEVENPDVLIIEGLNVLQPARPHSDGTTGLAISDFFDFSVYVDAEAQDIKQWFIDRFMGFTDSAFDDPNSFFAQWSHLSQDELLTLAHQVWDQVNGVNLSLNIEPTRSRATVILKKGPNHVIDSVRIRKI